MANQAEPTIEMIKKWNAKELLEWIQQNRPELLEGDTLEKFKALEISGRLFIDLAGNMEFFQNICKLPIGPSMELAILAREMAGGETASTQHTADPMTRKRKSPPHVRTPPLLKRIRVDNSSLILNGKLEYFQSGSDTNFSKLLQEDGQAYFDRTRYISKLHYLHRSILFCRPRRFGKSLTVSMLEHFHGLQFRSEHESLYKGLDVQKDIDEGRVKPGQYFVLKFDFSRSARTPDLTETNENLITFLNSSIKNFYRTYTAYLGGNFADLCQNIDSKRPNISLNECVESVRYAIQQDKRLAEGIYLLIDEYDALSNKYLEPPTTVEQSKIAWDDTPVGLTFRSFWDAIKSFGAEGIIRRIFITGISPLSLSVLGSGFNVTRNLSFHRDLAGLCGLTSSDLEEALALIHEDSEASGRSFSEMSKYFNGYHFCQDEMVQTVYNTETCLAYLQCRIEGVKPRTEDPENSEVSEELLRRCATSALVIRDFEKTLACDEEQNFTPIEYDRFKPEFTLRDLSEGVESGSSWRSLVVYSGGLTFHPEKPTTHLKIPNSVAAERIARAVLKRFNLRDTLPVALLRLATDGELEPILGCYRGLMKQRDNNYTDLTQTTEERHRDSFYFCLLRNPDLAPRAEFKVIKPDRTNGRIDLVLPASGRLIVTEWKFYRINFLDMRGADDVAKADTLFNYELQQILELRFASWDKIHRDKTDPDKIYQIQEWVKEKEAPQLRSYIKSNDVQQLMREHSLELHAYLVIIVGSRHILLWDMDTNGTLAEEPRLV